MKLIQGDCLEKLKELDSESVDAVITDPPSSINFMGLSWDSDKGGRDQWICVAAKQLNRNFTGIELEPEYVKICNQRLENLDLTS